MLKKSKGEHKHETESKRKRISKKEVLLTQSNECSGRLANGKIKSKRSCRENIKHDQRQESLPWMWQSLHASPSSFRRPPFHVPQCQVEAPAAAEVSRVLAHLCREAGI